MKAFLITSSKIAALQFAREMGWSIETTNGPIVLADREGPIDICMHPDDFEGVKRAVVHQGYFDRTPEAQALKRWLLNRVEARGFHLIEYETGGDRPPEVLRICLVCGRDRPCMFQEDLGPEEPGTPCTFDPTLSQLLYRLRLEEQKNVDLRRSVEVLTEALYGITHHIKEAHRRISEVERRAEKAEGQTTRFSRFPYAVSGR